MTTLLADPATTGAPVFSGDAWLAELDRIEGTLGHRLVAEEWPEPGPDGVCRVQRWICSGCGAGLERRFADGAVTGPGVTTPCHRDVP